MFSRLHRSSLSLLPFRRIRQEPVLYSSGAPLGTFPTPLPGKKKRGTRSPSKHAGRGVLREFISEGGCKSSNLSVKLARRAMSSELPVHLARVHATLCPRRITPFRVAIPSSPSS
ncbi:hypothetical protein MHYP_G00156780 [Metynnis hypsauchen]